MLAATHFFLNSAALYQFAEPSDCLLDRFAVTDHQLNHFVSICIARTFVFDLNYHFRPIDTPQSMSNAMMRIGVRRTVRRILICCVRVEVGHPMLTKNVLSVYNRGIVHFYDSGTPHGNTQAFVSATKFLKIFPCEWRSAAFLIENLFG